MILCVWNDLPSIKFKFFENSLDGKEKALEMVSYIKRTYNRVLATIYNMRMSEFCIIKNIIDYWAVGIVKVKWMSTSSIIKKLIKKNELSLPWKLKWFFVADGSNLSSTYINTSPADRWRYIILYNVCGTIHG